MAEGQAGGFPIATIITTMLNGELVAGITFGELYLLRDPRVGVRLHPGDPGRGDPDDVLDEPRPAPARRRHLGPGQFDASRRPPTRRSRSGVLAALPILVLEPARRLLHVHRGHRPDLPQLLPVQPRRPRGPTPRLAAQAGLVQPWPMGHADQHPRAGLRRADDHQHRHLVRPGLFGDFGGEGRDFTNPGFGLFFTPFGNTIEGLPDMADVRADRRRCSSASARCTTLLSIRGRAADVEADTATGEAVIG